MKLNFYSKLIILLFLVISHCFTATAANVAEEETKQPQLNLKPEEQAAYTFLTGQDNERCVKYNKIPGEIDNYKGNTDAINDLLSNKEKVDLNVQASDDMKKTIFIAILDEKITHYDSAKDHTLKSKLNEKGALNKSELDKSDPRYYAHFRVLELMDDIASSFVPSILSTVENDEILNKADKSLYNSIFSLSQITRDMISECLTIARSKHQVGIQMYVEQIAAEELIKNTVINISSSSTDLESKSNELKVEELDEKGNSSDIKVIQQISGNLPTIFSLIPDDKKNDATQIPNSQTSSDGNKTVIEEVKDDLDNKEVPSSSNTGLREGIINNSSTATSTDRKSAADSTTEIKQGNAEEKVQAAVAKASFTPATELPNTAQYKEIIKKCNKNKNKPDQDKYKIAAKKAYDEALSQYNKGEESKWNASQSPANNTAGSKKRK